MSKRTQVILVCDMCGGEGDNVRAVPFALDGTTYEIDMCDGDAHQLADTLAPFVVAGRRVPRTRRKRSAG